MKKIFCLVAGALLMCVPARAIPAKPGLFTFTQSDGTTLQVRQLGDEFLHSAVTADGLTIERGADGDFYYCASGVITTQRAHDAASRSAAEQAFLAQNEGQFVFGSTANGARRVRTRQASPIRRATQVPNNGSPRVPIILVQYKDKKMSNTKEKFEAQYKTNAKSVLQYFTDQSNGLYTPQYDIYGIYTLDNNRSTYGGNSGGSDKGVARMVGEAISKAGNAIDWSQYDNDGDGEADVCIVVYAGVGEAQAYGVVPNAVWPCQWSLSAGAYYGDGSGAVTRNGITIDKFAVFNEVGGSNDNGTTLDGIGTFCHEYSHCLGLPDFYETNSYSSGYYGMGSWSLMDTGCYNGGAVDGDTPIGYSAYEKNFMGWLDYITPQENTQYTLPVFNSKNRENDQAIQITALNNNEYWILENRRKQGWDYYIADEGVLITHFTYVPDRWDDNSVNNKSVQLATIIAADNSLNNYNEEKDLFGETNHAFTNTSTPAMKANMKANGSLTSSTGGAGAVNKPVTDINLNSDGTASLWYMKGALPSLTAPVLADATGATTESFTAMWTHSTTIECTYTLNVTQGSSTVLNQTGITDKAFTVTGLDAGKTYSFKVKAVPVSATEANESAWSNVKTVTLPEGPTIVVNPGEVAFEGVTVGESATHTVQLLGANLEGDVTLTLDDPNSVFAVSCTAVSKSEAQAGKAITVTFTPSANVDYTATLLFSSANARTVTMTLAGNGTHQVPLLLATDTTQVAHTAFRAEWTDDTPADFIDSYTLQVDYWVPNKTPELLEEADFSNLEAVLSSSWWGSGSYTNVASSASDYLPEGWSASSPMYVDDGAIIVGSTIKTPAYTLSEGFDKISVVLQGRSFNSSRYGNSQVELSLSGSGLSQSQTLADEDAEYVYVLDAESTEALTFTGTNYPEIVSVKVYAGDVSAQASAPLLAAIERGDSLNRVITGITDTFYTVKDLAAGGTFTYKVKAVYANQTESAWSNVERVTLAQQPDAPEYLVGDVNGNGSVDIDDVNILLNIILELDTADRYDGRANVDGTGKVDIQDVNDLINIILAQ